MANELIIIEPGAISKADKTKMEKAGYVVIEAKDPSKIKVMHTLSSLQGDDIMRVAIKTINSHHVVYAKFGEEMCRMLLQKLQPDPPPIK